MPVIPLPQLRVQPSPPQLHVASPLQFTVHPPSAQMTLQTLLPVQSSFEEGLSVTLQVLPPPQLTVEPEPVVTAQVLCPAQLAVEFAPMFCMHVLFAEHWVVQLLPQEPLHTESLEQCEVQLLPQLTLQVLFLAQSNAMSDGRVAAPATPPSALAPPKVQLLPEEQLHSVAVHEHAPVQLGGAFLPHAPAVKNAAPKTSAQHTSRLRADIKTSRFS